MRKLRPRNIQDVIRSVCDKFGVSAEDVRIDFWCRDGDDRRCGARFIGFFIPQYESAVVIQRTDGTFHMYSPSDLKRNR